MAVGHYVFLVSVCSIIAALLAAAAVGTPAWFKIDAASHYRIGMFQRCSVRGGLSPSSSCSSIEYTDFCEHTDGALKMRHFWSIGLGVLSSLLLMICGGLTLHGWTNYTVHSTTMMALPLMAVMSMTACISLFTNTYDGWYYCNLSFCEYAEYYLGESSCTVEYGYSFILACLSVIVALLALTVTAMFMRDRRSGLFDDAEGDVRMRYLASKYEDVAKRPQSPREEGDRSASERAKALPSASTPPGQQQNSATAAAGRFFSPLDGGKTPAKLNESDQNLNLSGIAAHHPPPEGTDWEFVADCGYYWSQKEFLYFDPKKGHYYDPKSDHWYDPATKEWLHREV